MDCCGLGKRSFPALRSQTEFGNEVVDVALIAQLSGGLAQIFIPHFFILRCKSGAFMLSALAATSSSPRRVCS